MNVRQSGWMGGAKAWFYKESTSLFRWDNMMIASASVEIVTRSWGSRNVRLMSKVDVAGGCVVPISTLEVSGPTLESLGVAAAALAPKEH